MEKSAQNNAKGNKKGNAVFEFKTRLDIGPLNRKQGQFSSSG
jgi:hypothetical protein